MTNEDKLKEFAEEEAELSKKYDEMIKAGAANKREEHLALDNTLRRINELKVLQRTIKNIEQFGDIASSIEATAYQTVIDQIIPSVMDTRVMRTVNHLQGKIEKLKK